MPIRGFARKWLPSADSASMFDLVVAVVLLCGGLFYHADYAAWSQFLVGECNYGDPEFWWDGALRVSEANIRNHPGTGFRPGFFVLAGLTLPVLGPAVQGYHQFLVILFLSACVLLYLTLRNSFGRPAAAIGAALAVFSPYSAQWLATPTTDGTGLVLHLLGLICLLRAVAHGFHLGWLAGFGFMFALGTLTRPLMTPFLGAALIGVLCLAPGTYRRRIGAAAAIAFAYFAPTFLWMGAQRVLVKEWSISNNDASAFYAASQPQLQVWNPFMYEAIANKARVRFQVAEPNMAQLNSMFWRETLRGYWNHRGYHLDRVFSHVWLMAYFPLPSAPWPAAVWQAVLLASLSGSLCLGMLWRRQWWRAVLLAGATAALALMPAMAAVFTLTGVVLALLPPSREPKHLAPLLVAGYWLCGVGALYLTGGTSCAPLAAEPFVNSLGYRLSTQVAFCGGLLACFGLFQVARIHLAAERAGERVAASGEVSRPWPLVSLVGRIYLRPSAVAVRTIQAGFVGLAAGVVTVYLWGAIVVVQRAQAHSAAPQREYPDLAPVVAHFQRTRAQHFSGSEFIAADHGSLTRVLTAPKATKDSKYVFTRGQVGPLVWSLNGQERTLFRLYPERFVSPAVREASSHLVQVPASFSRAEWAGTRGAFVLRSIPDNQEFAYLPQYHGGPVVRAFVPLAEDGRSYDVERAVWFPLDLGATQLQALDALACPCGRIQWNVPEAWGVRGRRFIVRNVPDGSERRAVLKIDLGRVTGSKTLSFSYQWSVNGYFDPATEAAAAPALKLRVEGIRTETGERVLLDAAEETVLDARTAAAPKKVRIEPHQLQGMAAVELAWSSGNRNGSVCLEELILRAEELQP